MVHTPTVHYLFFVVATFFAALFLALEYDLLRNWDMTSDTEKKLQVEEIFVLGSILVVGLLVFAWRGMRERKHELVLRVAAEREAHQSARQDTLTGLPNRRLFAERAGEALNSSWARGTECAVLFIDLDGFKPVNDTLGHTAGDAVLVVIADRLRSCVPEPGMVARLGGDEFAALLETPRGGAAADLLARRILREIEQPITVDGRNIAVSATIGIAIGPGEGRRAEDLIHAADLAMYEGKRSGRGTVVRAVA